MPDNSKKNWFLLVMWLTGAMTFAIAIKGQNSAVEARVTSISGKAAISGNGRGGNAKLTRGTILVPGDQIDTTAGGRVVIDLSDGSQVVVLPGSRVNFADYRNASSLRELL